MYIKIISSVYKMQIYKPYKNGSGNENWNDPNTASYWAKRYLWSYSSKSEAYENIKKDLKRKGFL